MRQITCIKNRRYVEVDLDSTKTIVRAIYGAFGFNQYFTLKDVASVIPNKSRNLLSHNLISMSKRNYLRTHLLHRKKRVYLMPVLTTTGKHSKAYLILKN